jgi:uncharacterized protein
MTMPIIPVEKPRSFPPRVTAFTRRFWDGLREGRFDRVAMCTIRSQ